MKKKLIYWGTGNIGSICLKLYPDIIPQFFIDSHRESDMFYNIPVKKPENISNWDNLYIVVTTTAFQEIEKILNNKNLKRNENYIGYQEFFEVERNTVVESINSLKIYIEKNKQYKNSILISASVFAARVWQDMIHFFQCYSIKRLPQRSILFSSLSVVSEKRAEKVMGYPVFNVPDICKWEGHMDVDIDFNKNPLIHGDLLLKEEKEWIWKLEERKLQDDKTFSFHVTSEIYWYYKQVISILEPSQIIIWGGWTRESYILAELAKRNNIPYGFMEFGWIPGTYQFDRRGIAGQSEYAVNSDSILKRPVEYKSKEIKEIRDYIVRNKIDTGKFRKNGEDERALARINQQKKTVFFVGMGDSSMGINPESDYWKQYVSSFFSSTQEAVSFVAEICRRNEWNFVFKPHPSPANKDGLAQDKLGDTIIQVKYTEIDRLIELSDVVISIASAVNYKVLIYGKPLVQLGHTTLSQKGCCYEIQSIDEIEAQLRNALENGMTEVQNENFEFHMEQLLENYLWDDLSDRALRYGLSLETDFFSECNRR
jgi:sarcosine oxidase delta subunit